MDRLKGLIARFMDTRFMKLVMRGIKIFGEADLTVFAGYVTLFIVTSIFPCIMLIIAIVNLLPGYSAKDVADILFQILPDMGLIKDLIESIMINLKAQSGGLLASAAAVTTLWSASKGVNALQKGLNHMEPPYEELKTAKDDAGLKEKAKSTAKHLLKRLLFTLALIILIPALLVFEMLGDSLSGVICNTLEKIQPDVLTNTLSKIDTFFHASSLAVMVLAVLVILAIYAILPEKHRTFKSQIPGAVLAAVCWLAFTKLFSLFIPQFFNSSLYGSLASLFLMLLWLWAVVIILFGGGVLNHALEGEKLEKEQLEKELPRRRISRRKNVTQRRPLRRRSPQVF